MENENITKEEQLRKVQTNLEHMAFQQLLFGQKRIKGVCDSVKNKIESIGEVEDLSCTVNINDDATEEDLWKVENHVKFAISDLRQAIDFLKEGEAYLRERRAIGTALKVSSKD